MGDTESFFCVMLKRRGLKLPLGDVVIVVAGVINALIFGASVVEVRPCGRQ